MYKTKILLKERSYQQNVFGKHRWVKNSDLAFPDDVDVMPRPIAKLDHPCDPCAILPVYIQSYIPWAMVNDHFWISTNQGQRYKISWLVIGQWSRRTIIEDEGIVGPRGKLDAGDAVFTLG